MSARLLPDMPTILLQLNECLTAYRTQTQAWYGGMLDAEQTFSAGQSAITRSIDSKQPAIHYAHVGSRV